MGVWHLGVTKSRRVRGLGPTVLPTIDKTGIGSEFCRETRVHVIWNETDQAMASEFYM